MVHREGGGEWGGDNKVEMVLTLKMGQGHQNLIEFCINMFG